MSRRTSSRHGLPGTRLQGCKIITSIKMLTLNKKNEKWIYILLSSLIFFSFYYAIGGYYLFDNNEGLYAGIAKNMLLFRDFIIPNLNGVPYIEKPPLLYWLLSASFAAFGLNAFAARFVTATSAALVCVFLLYFTKKIKKEEAGIIGAIIFASSIGVSIIARMVYFDMLFTCTVTGALLSFFYWYESRRISVLRLGYVFLGLAILTKGLIAGIIICGTFIVFLIADKDYKGLYKILDPLGIFLCLAVILPWHVAATIKHKGFFWTYIIEEHFLRFLAEREPLDYYQGPIYYYLPRMMIYLLPWSFFAPLLFWRTKTLTTPERTFLKFNWCWLLVPLLFFSLSKAKANYYMIVSMPAICCMLGVKLIHLVKNHAKVFRAWNVCIILFITLTLGGVFLFVKDPVLKEMGGSLFVATILYGFVASVLSFVLSKKKFISFVFVSLLIVPMSLIMVSGIKLVEDDISAAGAGIYLTKEAKDAPLYIYQDFENISAVGFYAPDHFKSIDSHSNDLYYGRHLPEYKNLFLDKKAFMEEDLNKKVYVVMLKKKLEQFNDYIKPLKFYPVKFVGDVVILSNKKD